MGNETSKKQENETPSVIDIQIIDEKNRIDNSNPDQSRNNLENVTSGDESINNKYIDSLNKNKSVISEPKYKDDVIDELIEYDKKRLNERQKLLDRGNFLILENINDYYESDKNYIEGYAWRAKSDKISNDLNIDREFEKNFTKKIHEINNVTVNIVNRLHSSNIQIDG